VTIKSDTTRSTSRVVRYPDHVMTTVPQEGSNSEILIPWNATRSAIVEGLSLIYDSSRYLIGFYTVDDTPRSPFVLVFGLTGDFHVVPPCPHGGSLVLTRDARREEILEALNDDRYPFLCGYIMYADSVQLLFSTERACDDQMPGGEGTAP
jgi:hypothetical protein